MKHFANIEAIKNATVEELKSLPSMNEKSAKDVYDFFSLICYNFNISNRMPGRERHICEKM